MIAEICTGNNHCKCGATGCPVVCGYTIVYKLSTKFIIEKKKKTYSKFISSRINRKGNRF